MDFLPKDLSEYVEAHTEPENSVLRELNRETNLKVMMPQMLSGQLQGMLLKMISQMIQPEKILEIGTYTGYSAICLAQGLKSNGILHTIDINEELKKMAAGYFEKAGLQSKIKHHVGNALDIIPKLEDDFDLVFIDADKQNYSNYYDLVLPKMKKGGFLIADNVLWSGKVAEEKKDKDTQAIDNFNKKVQADNRVENMILPVRDGLMVVRKT